MDLDWNALKLLWEIVVSIVAGVACTMAWSVRRQAADARILERLALLEAKAAGSPGSVAMHELALSIERVAGELKAYVARLEGLKEIVNRLDRITERQEDYLLQSKGGD